MLAKNHKMIKISVKVKTRAKEERVERSGENSFSVWVKEPAEKGRANKAVAQALARHFKVPRENARIVAGQRSRQKVVEIRNK